MARKGLLAALVAAVALAGGGSAEPARVAVPPIAVTATEPLAGRASIYVERVAAPYQGGTETWLLNLDVQLANKQPASLLLERVDIRYPGSAIEPRTVSYSPRVPDSTFKSFESRFLPVPETRLFPFPVAPSVSVSFHFDGYRDPIVVTRSLEEWTSAVPGGGYRFPFAREDLPEGMYVSDDDTHLVGSGHRGSDSQRFAYDYGVFRWNGSNWTAYKVGTQFGRRLRNRDFLIWDVPVRAMADGWVLNCVVGVKDQVPGVRGTLGGNRYRIVHARGEVALYAHLRQGTIPKSLCPRNDVDFAPNRIRVKAGQILGRAGNSGRSTGPHLHVHIGTTGKDGEQGLPLVFRDLRVRSAGVDWKGSPPCTGTNMPFALVARAATGPWQLADPLFRPGHPELARHGLEDICFQDHYEAIAQAGYGMSWLGGFDIAGKTYLNVVFSKTAPQIVRFGLTGDQYQTELEKAIADGLRPTHVESYLRGGQVRYAFFAEKKSGPEYRAYHGVPISTHDDSTKQLAARQMVPVAVSVVSAGGGPRVTALWEKRNIGTWQLRAAIPVSEYQSWLAGQVKAGRHLVYLDAWMSTGKAMLSAIVSSKAGKAYVARHNLTPSKFQQEYETWAGKGLRTRAVTAYRVGNAVRYAALWR